MVQACKEGSTYAFCAYCNTDISVAGGGKTKVERHMKTAKHMHMLSQRQAQPTLNTFITEDVRSISDEAIRAEIYFAKFVAEHNLPFLVADQFSRLTKVMFPDSKIAEAYSCARTKTAAIITHALAPAMREEVVHACCSSAFTILCDGGNDHFDKKYFTVLVRYWDDKVNHVVTQFLAMPVCNKADAEHLFDALNTAMEEHDIPWQNVVGYASDTPNVMVGAHNSELSHVRDRQPQVFSLGCLDAS